MMAALLRSAQLVTGEGTRESVLLEVRTLRAGLKCQFGASVPLRLTITCSLWDILFFGRLSRPTFTGELGAAALPWLEASSAL